MKLKYLGTDKKTDYNGFDPVTKDNVVAKRGETVVVSSQKGSQLINDYPDEWKVISGVSQPTVTSLEVAEFEKKKKELDKLEKELIDEKKEINKIQKAQAAELKKRDKELEKLEEEKKQLEKDKTDLNKAIKDYEAELKKLRDKKAK